MTSAGDGSRVDVLAQIGSARAAVDQRERAGGRSPPRGAAAGRPGRRASRARCECESTPRRPGASAHEALDAVAAARPRRRGCLGPTRRRCSAAGPRPRPDRDRSRRRRPGARRHRRALSPPAPPRGLAGSNGRPRGRRRACVRGYSGAGAGGRPGRAGTAAGVAATFSTTTRTWSARPGHGHGLASADPAAEPRHARARPGQLVVEGQPLPGHEQTTRRQQRQAQLGQFRKIRHGSRDHGLPAAAVVAGRPPGSRPGSRATATRSASPVASTAVFQEARLLADRLHEQSPAAPAARRPAAGRGSLRRSPGPRTRRSRPGAAVAAP